jgi:hypothetical protein
VKKTIIDGEEQQVERLTRAEIGQDPAHHRAGRLPAEKVVSVVGSSSSDEAKIAGITPAGFTLTGRWLDPPS